MAGKQPIDISKSTPKTRPQTDLMISQMPAVTPMTSPFLIPEIPPSMSEQDRDLLISCLAQIACIPLEKVTDPTESAGGNIPELNELIGETKTEKSESMASGRKKAVVRPRQASDQQRHSPHLTGTGYGQSTVPILSRDVGFATSSAQTISPVGFHLSSPSSRTVFTEPLPQTSIGAAVSAPQSERTDSHFLSAPHSFPQVGHTNAPHSFTPVCHTSAPHSFTEVSHTSAPHSFTQVSHSRSPHSFTQVSHSSAPHSFTQVSHTSAPHPFSQVGFTSAPDSTPQVSLTSSSSPQTTFCFPLSPPSQFTTVCQAMCVPLSPPCNAPLPHTSLGYPFSAPPRHEAVSHTLSAPPQHKPPSHTMSAQFQHTTLRPTLSEPLLALPECVPFSRETITLEEGESTVSAEGEDCLSDEDMAMAVLAIIERENSQEMGSVLPQKPTSGFHDSPTTSDQTSPISSRQDLTNLQGSLPITVDESQGQMEVCGGPDIPIPVHQTPLSGFQGQEIGGQSSFVPRPFLGGPPMPYRHHEARTSHGHPFIMDLRPDPGTTSQEGQPRLWKFILDVLEDPRYNPSLITWVSRPEGIFRLTDPGRLAEFWGHVKGNKSMNYEKFSRGLRYYYTDRVLEHVPGKLVYKFGPTATQVWQYIAQSSHPYPVTTATSTVTSQYPPNTSC